MKKKLRPEDIRINVKVIAEMLDGELNGQRDRDTYSEQHGTGSLCVSIAMCMPTEKECNVSKSQGQLCCDTTVKCTFITKGCVSNDYCIVTDSMCRLTDSGCEASESLCQLSDACQQMSEDGGCGVAPVTDVGC